MDLMNLRRLSNNLSSSLRAERQAFLLSRSEINCRHDLKSGDSAIEFSPCFSRSNTASSNVDLIEENRATMSLADALASRYSSMTDLPEVNKAFGPSES